MEVITSLDNSKIKRLIKLKNKKYRDKEGVFIVETLNLIKEAINNSSLLEIYLTEDINIDIPSNISVTYVSEKIMKEISSLKCPSKVLGLSKFLEEKEIDKKILILDSIQDPGNMGTIIRSAVAFNIKTIIISNDSCDIYNDKVIRATEGNIYKVNILRRDLDNYLPKLKEKDYYIYGTDVLNGTSIKRVVKYDKMAIIIGSEGHGIKNSLKNYIDSNIYIPIRNTESLNASVAASIIMYEVGNYE